MSDSDLSDWDLLGALAEKGIEGQYFPFAIIPASGAERVTGVVDTSYGNRRLINIMVIWSDFQVEDLDIVLRLACRMENDTAGETSYIHLWNADDGEAIPNSELTTTGTGKVYRNTNWLNYTPPTTGSLIRIVSEVKVSGGGGSWYDPTVVFAYKL